ncbi:Mrp complex subunit C, sodium/proton antiporter subunit [Alkalihalophilus pseudofirmus OF4]|uniref:Na(+)/H(+) antiporter subunit C n=1 Tax=Alkalihalophilus pseudofirmus (strain ATCC BAA-2126 / JCM 17055 / OF4) TaxID=398511 RepID=MRPC_ALKPO|nr:MULTISPECIES: Na(+)/H(+) antiporter subunit C [Alkalihalophilus]Q9RGZ3.1 RecName: Full=Na(+)/H(+) antiporter subunit C; AltName: Full=Mrp complex subunit C; AltName: Full=Multiple resistance and pH homeostasis protein C [Alkalihalophilus pseudofirmus OF4]AAF21814.1 multiple resistance and pH regulation related protein C [Cytobacillus firmus]ADC50691.1 Mrp complex subunit C, sodium/proton antiporter subunit [Alkalihalophilus pseudofirmus OF4]MED1602557.1 Na(+)/H(+) antiporter subunit C [Alkal
MEILMSITAGVLFMVGTYLILTKSLLRVVVGLILLSHGAHLLLLTMAGLQRGAPPLLHLEATTYSDPLPQALILTAIVISFGVTSFLLVLAYRTYKEHKTDDLDQLRGSADE